MKALILATLAFSSVSLAEEYCGKVVKVEADGANYRVSFDSGHFVFPVRGERVLTALSADLILCLMKTKFDDGKPYWSFSSLSK